MNGSTAQQPVAVKVCPMCGARWRTCFDLLHDPEIEVRGCQSVGNGHGPRLVLFLHRKCGTTLALDQALVRGLIPKPTLPLAKIHRAPVSRPSRVREKVPA